MGLPRLLVCRAEMNHLLTYRLLNHDLLDDHSRFCRLSAARQQPCAETSEQTTHTHPQSPTTRLAFGRLARCCGIGTALLCNKSGPFIAGPGVKIEQQRLGHLEYLRHLV